MSGRATQLLNAIGDGDSAAAEELLPLVYSELRRIARARMAGERPGHTLQPTALVHEAYMRLVGDADIAWVDRRHFYAAAARAMRRILIDRARRVAREKHGGDLQRDSFGDHLAAELPRTDELLALDEALAGLEEQDATLAEIVRMRFFAGLTIAETARVLDVSSRTVNRQWLVARAWLADRMGRDDDGVQADGAAASA
ncbi:MAG: ECF-type sigma factor [Acidobacteriota bacterium]